MTATESRTIMATAFAENQVDEVIQDFVDTRTPFTALDISRRVQARIKAANQPYERHNDLKDHIHTCCNDDLDNTWKRTTIQIPNVVGRPFLYYPSEKLPADYDGIQAIPKPVTVGQATTVNTATINTTAVINDGGITFNKSNFLYVPKKHVRKFGLASGDRLNVYKDPGTHKVYLAKNPPDPAWQPVRDVRVNGRNSLRVTRAFLSGVGLTGASFDIEEDGGRIIIKLHGAN